MAEEEPSEPSYDTENTENTSEVTNSETVTETNTGTGQISASESGLPSASENTTVTVDDTVVTDIAQPSEPETEVDKPEAKGEDELDQEIFDGLRLSETTLTKYRNPYDEIRLAYWNDDVKSLVQNLIKSVSNVNVIFRKLLEEKVFVIIYEEGFYKHQEMLDLLSFLQEPFELVSSKVLESNELSYDFWEFELKPMCDPPFVIYEDRVFRNLEELEELLYRRLVSQPISNFSSEKAENEYDLIIIGNTVAGKTAAMEAMKFTDSVLLINCIEDSYSSKNWNIKIMYASTKMLEQIRLGYRFGFCDTVRVNLIWKDIVDIVNLNAKRSLFKERISLRQLSSINARPKFTINGELRILSSEENSEERIVKGMNYIIATGSAPKIPNDIIGVLDHCISVDKLLTMTENPNDTLFIGDSSDGLECAGILNACEFNVTIVVGSGMHDCQNYEESFVKEIRKVMEIRGVRFIDGCRILKVSLTESNSKKVEGLYEDGSVFIEEFKTVVISLGRIPRTSYLGLTKVGVKVSKSRHIIVDQFDMTNKANIFAIGRVVEGNPESDSYSEKSAKYLVQRLLNFGANKVKYGPIPKTVLTPIEYGCIGLTEKLAEQLLELKLQNLKTVLVYENTNETFFQLFPETTIKLKLLCSENDYGEKMILGIHLLGNNIGELIQGLSALVGISRPINRFDKVLSCSLCRNVFENLVLTKTLPINEKIVPVVNIENVERLIRIINTGKHGAEVLEKKCPDENIAKDDKQILMEESILSTDDKVRSYSDCSSLRSVKSTGGLIFDHQIFENDSEDSVSIDEESSSSSEDSSSSTGGSSSSTSNSGSSDIGDPSDDVEIVDDSNKNVKENSDQMQSNVADKETTEENKVNNED